MDGIHAECCQVSLLQRVLAKKRDPGSHICFMELLKSECKDETFQLERDFWDTVTNVLSQELLLAAQGKVTLIVNDASLFKRFCFLRV